MATNSIFNNTLSNTAQKFLEINTRRVGQSIERISSGIRVNRAADDVAGPSVRYPRIEAGSPEPQ